ncbi:MAG: dTDP-4-dehydrorhamnose reductase [Candidatus Kuenenbacteria bacterium]
MKIALIGASGQLGADLQKVIPKDYLTKLNYPDFDITNRPGIQKLIKKEIFDIVINTAAYNLVDRAEEYPEEAMDINYQGVKNLVDACKKEGIKLVHYSTDYVFGSDKNRQNPYTENDKPGPICKYGESKLAGEREVQENLHQYFLIRTSGLFGEAGSEGKGDNFIESIIKKANTNLSTCRACVPQPTPELKIVDDQILTPTYTLDLAKQTWKLIQTSNYGLYHITSEGECSWYDFASEVFRCLNKEIQLMPVKTNEYNLPAERPLYSVLENAKLKRLGLNIMRPWQETAPDYLKEKGYIA